MKLGMAAYRNNESQMTESSVKGQEGSASSETIASLWRRGGNVCVLERRRGIIDVSVQYIAHEENSILNMRSKIICRRMSEAAMTRRIIVIGKILSIAQKWNKYSYLWNNEKTSQCRLRPMWQWNNKIINRL